MFRSSSEHKLALMGMGARAPTSSTAAYDVEAGTLRSRNVLRLLTRRAKVIGGSLLILTLLLYVFSPGRPPPSHDAWTEDMDRWVLDDNGDRFLYAFVEPVAAMHPTPEELLPPERFFPEVDAGFLKLPNLTKYPVEELDKVICEHPPPAKEVAKEHWPEDSFSQTWEGPEEWDVDGPGVPTVQWDGFSGEYESGDEKKLREQRQQAVKRGFMYAWQKYKDHAWGHDEVRPVSLQVSNPFNNWGASIVDTLDTLLVMGLEDEYNLCRLHVNQINFHWIKGRDWSQGYAAPKSEASPSGDVWKIGRDMYTQMPVFETGIRYLGGLLGAYDLSGDKLMLERATDLAHIIKVAFNTRTGLLHGGGLDPGKENGVYMLFHPSVAEVGSMSLELIRLSKLTGDRQWFDFAQRTTDYLELHVAPRSILSPLIPMRFSPEGNGTVDGTFNFGAMCDSYYEYLLKAYKLLGGGPLAEPYKRLYEGSVDMAAKVLYADVKLIPGLDLFTLGRWDYRRMQPETEHLACFAGGMLGMGSKLLQRPDDMTAAERFTSTCYWLSAATPLGVQPEVARFYRPEEEYGVNVTIDGRIVHPPMAGVDPMLYNHHEIYEDAGKTYRWRDDDTPVAEDSGRAFGQITYYRRINGIIPGTRSVQGRYINRPETIESIYYMYRLTGDKKWQEKGWRMFTSWMSAGKAAGGISSIRDVTDETPRHDDNMESFIFAETFKYHYLLQSEPDLLSLDDYVYNTEAHPLIANGIKPGSQGLWTPVEQDLGVRGQGTDAQKHVRREVLEMHRRAWQMKLENERKKLEPVMAPGI